MYKRIEIKIRLVWQYIKRFFIKGILRKKLTPEGEELYKYCEKVLTEDYSPVSMRDFALEKKANPNNYAGKERRLWISCIYLQLWLYY